MHACASSRSSARAGDISGCTSAMPRMLEGETSSGHTAPTATKVFRCERGGGRSAAPICTSCRPQLRHQTKWWAMDFVHDQLVDGRSSAYSRSSTRSRARAPVVAAERSFTGRNGAAPRRTAESCRPVGVTLLLLPRRSDEQDPTRLHAVYCSRFSGLVMSQDGARRGAVRQRRLPKQMADGRQPYEAFRDDCVAREPKG